jgi:hypothetical protein
MVVHSCNKCGKSFDQKCHYNVHINRKKSCCNNIDNDSNDVFFVKNELHNDKLVGNNELLKNNLQNNENINILDENKLTICKHCNKNFSTNGSLKRHLNDRCKVLKQNDNEKLDFVKIVNELKEQNDELKKMVLQLVNNNMKVDNIDGKNDNNINNGTIVNNGNTNANNLVNGNVTTNNNNIKIEFGKEDLSKLSNDFYIKTLINSSGALIPCKIIEGLHFNPELKENMNVYITDTSRNKAMVYDGTQWTTANADEVVNKLFDKAIILCEDRNEELYDKIQKNDKIKKKINKEMYVMNIMSNNEVYEYNEHKEPVDSEGNVLNLSELKRGLSLNGVAKEHIRRSLCNKKTIIIK